MTAPICTAPKLRLEEFTAGDFAALWGRVFLFQPPAAPEGIRGEAVAMELVEVTTYRKLETSGRSQRREPFSLLFRSVQKWPVLPGLHTVIHDACELGPIFVSRIQPPAGTHPGEVYYEAVFN